MGKRLAPFAGVDGNCRMPGTPIAITRFGNSDEMVAEVVIVALALVVEAEFPCAGGPNR